MAKNGDGKSDNVKQKLGETLKQKSPEKQKNEETCSRLENASSESNSETAVDNDSKLASSKRKRADMADAYDYSAKYPKAKCCKFNEKGEPIMYEAPNGEVYKPGDCVFLDSQRADQPYFICSIEDFRMSKKDTVQAVVKWYYRTSEVPHSVYQLLVQDRNVEHSDHSKDVSAHHPHLKDRELFISDATDLYSLNTIKGKCYVTHYKDFISAVRGYTPKENSFFYVLTYNPETRRLASHTGEIRVGSSYQVIKLPECKAGTHPRDMPERTENWEELTWKPTMADGNLIMYLRAARSMAAFAGLCDGGTTKEGYLAASRDETTIQAMTVLHKSKYDTGKALQALTKTPVPRGIEKKWNEDETKRFQKGLRQFGKNFFKIRMELLSHKETGELIEYYYYWKKTPAANGTRPQRRNNRKPVLRRVKDRSRRYDCSNNKDADKEKNKSDSYLSSCSEYELDSEDSDTRDLSGYACRHCFTTSSKDWHHGGRDRILLCTTCRLYFKCYGELPRLKDSQDSSNFMFQPGTENGLLNGQHSMQPSVPCDTNICQKNGESEHSSPFSSLEGQKSPSSGSTCSNSSDRSSLHRKPQADESSTTSNHTGEDLTSVQPESKDGKSKSRSVSPESNSNLTEESGSLSNEENSNEGENQNRLLLNSNPNLSTHESHTNSIQVQAGEETKTPSVAARQSSPLSLRPQPPPLVPDSQRQSNDTSKVADNLKFDILTSKVSESKSVSDRDKYSMELPRFGNIPALYPGLPRPDATLGTLENFKLLDRTSDKVGVADGKVHLAPPQFYDPSCLLHPSQNCSVKHAFSSAFSLPKHDEKSVKNSSDVKSDSSSSTKDTLLTTQPAVSDASASILPKTVSDSTQPATSVSVLPKTASDLVQPATSVPVLPQTAGDLVGPTSTSVFSDKSRTDNLEVKQEVDVYEYEDEEEEKVELRRTPSPEPTVDNTELCRTKSAIFIRSLYRGKYNSCSRCDITFKPTPESCLAKERIKQKRISEQNEKEEKKPKEAEVTPEKKPTPKKPITPQVLESTGPPRDSPRHLLSQDTPALRTLSQYARPHAAFSPSGPLPTSIAMGYQHQAVDPFLHYQLQLGLYPPGSRERMELENALKMEHERREREFRELEFREKMKSGLAIDMKPLGAGLPPGANPVEAARWAELQRQYMASNSAGFPGGLPPGFYPPGFLEREQLEKERLERFGMPLPPHTSGREIHMSAERLHIERMMAADPMARLNMPSTPTSTALQAHMHAHSHTHLHVHDPNAPNQQPVHLLGGNTPSSSSETPFHPPPVGSGVSPFVPPPSALAGVPRPPYAMIDPVIAAAAGPPHDLIRPYDPLNPLAAVHAEHLQRQMLMDRERQQQQHAMLAQEEYIRQQQHEQVMKKEREQKLRALEDAARGGGAAPFHPFLR